MKNSIYLFVIFLCGCAFFSPAPPEKYSYINDSELLADAQKNFQILPKGLINEKKLGERIKLGKKLFFEEKLSLNGTISCNSCHRLDNFGVDNLQASPGHNGQFGTRNSPTVYNSVLNFTQFWDGRSKDLESAVLEQLLNPLKHGLKSHAHILQKIDDQDYRNLFNDAFPGEKENFTTANVAKAIATFQKTLLTPSAFDDYLEGEIKALSWKQKAGLKKFIEIGCINCHGGVLLGGSSFEKLGKVNDFRTLDLGRFEVTKSQKEQRVFKVPTLRNIEKTSPYLHDGSNFKLKSVIEIMAKHQLGKTLSHDDAEEIESFLASLTAKKVPRKFYLQ